MSIATDLQIVYDNLQTVLTDCNTALTGKGGAEAQALNGVAAAITALPSGSGGAELPTLPTLNNPAADSDVVSGKEYIDQNGAKRTGTMTPALPSWISECEIQTFTPTEDTTEAHTFSFSTLTKRPHIFIVSCDGVLGSYEMLDFLGCSKVLLHRGGSLNKDGGHYAVYARGASNPYGGNVGSTVFDGTNVTVTLPTYGSYGSTFWRSKYTYTVMALSLTFGGASE